MEVGSGPLASALFKDQLHAVSITSQKELSLWLSLTPPTPIHSFSKSHLLCLQNRPWRSGPGTLSLCLHMPHTHTTASSADLRLSWASALLPLAPMSCPWSPCHSFLASCRSFLEITFPGRLSLKIQFKNRTPLPLHLPALLPTVNWVTPLAHSFARARGLVCSSPCCVLGT